MRKITEGWDTLHAEPCSHRGGRGSGRT